AGAALRAQLRPHDRTTRLLLASLAGLVALAAGEAALSMLVGPEPFVGALYGTVKNLATIGPNPVVDRGPDWFKLYASATSALSLALMAIFTAALVGRLLAPRFTGVLGRRTLPRADHVVVVGLGQVGLRLCLELRALGVPVAAVERDPDSPHVRLAQRLELPVVIGNGGDRFVLERLSLHRARALAAVTSDELTNIAVSVTALAVAPRVRTVLRAGSNDVTRETQVLFPIGVAQDLHRIAAATLVASALGRDVVQSFVHDGASYVHLAGDAIERFPAVGGVATS
ncbi:MAG: NAD-binding protein, partial [Conexibacter sp.]